MFKIDCRKTFCHIIKNEKHTPIKLGKRPGKTYCLGCKDHTHNFRPQEVKITNKVPGEKSNCVVCRSNKS